MRNRKFGRHLDDKLEDKHLYFSRRRLKTGRDACMEYYPREKQFVDILVMSMSYIITIISDMGA